MFLKYMNKRMIKTVAALLIATAAGVCVEVSAQEISKQDPLLKIYRETSEKVNDLVHTKLDVRFDYGKRYLYGKAWITLKPHFYSTDSLRLDAKGMAIKNVSLIETTRLVPLKYDYNGEQLAVKLGRKFNQTEKYTVFIDYTAKPDEYKAKGSAAITDAKGLYFINPDGKDKDKPVQIWTQGETEGSSVWFPTIDRPNQKTTSEISMTVPSKYVSLSNGRLVFQKSNADGTRTDTWKMELPHSPYLFMMAVGDFSIYKDKWRDKEVNYYLEPAYAPYAKQIFGLTPEMMEFFSKKLGVDFPWNKYSQIVVRDYVSGAMENTTATLHGDFVQATDRELLDENKGEDVISHELFHQWFGDYVTAESWSNLTVNESLADFSESLWQEYKHGKDAGDAHGYKALESYLNSEEDYSKDLVRFHYHDKEDMFDAVSYQKGGRILEMLRNYLGDEAFFKGLNLYLRQNAFKNGEAHQLRLALEEVSGKDLNWFFNQWYFRSGHPVLVIDYKWDENSKTQQVIIRQTQKGEPFILPLAVDVYAAGKKERHSVWIRNKQDTLNFSVSARPDLVNVDADKVLLAQKTDNKPLSQFVYQYFNAPLYQDRLEAIEASAEKQQADAEARRVMMAALKDKFGGLRIKAINDIDLSDTTISSQALPVLLNLAKNDPKTLVQATAIGAVASLREPSNRPLFDEALKSRSYAVQAAALLGITFINKSDAFNIARSLENDSKGELAKAIVSVYALNGDTDRLTYVSDAFEKAELQSKVDMIPAYINLLSGINDSKIVNSRVSDFKSLAVRYKSYGIDKFVISLFEGMQHRKQSQLQNATPEVKEQLTQQISFIAASINELKAAN